MILPGRENPRNWVDPDEMKMRWCLSTPGSPEYVLPVAQSISITFVSPYTRRRSLTMYLEAIMKRVERCTLRPWSSEFGDALAGRDRVKWEMLLEAVIDRVWWCTWRPWSIEIGGVLGGGSSGGGRSGGRSDGSRDSIHWLTRNRGNVESWVQYGPPRDESWLAAGDSRSWDDPVLGVWSTRCMLYSVYAVLGVCCTRR